MLGIASDAAKIMDELVVSDDGVTGPVNVGNPGEFTIRELAETIIARTGSSSDLAFLPLPNDDPKQRRPDITLARDVLGWTPAITLDQGLGPTIEFFRDLLGEDTGSLVTSL